jgi:hypothetical protein
MGGEKKDMRIWFAGMALSNPSICHGNVSDHDLDRWFGKSHRGVSRAMVVAQQALEYADVMIAAVEAAQ